MTKLKREIPKLWSNVFLVVFIAITLVLSFLTYQQGQTIEKLELKLDKNYQIQERAIEAMKSQNIFEEFINLDQFTDEERELIRQFAEELRS
jgi:hypothetical protein